MAGLTHSDITKRPIMPVWWLSHNSSLLKKHCYPPKIKTCHSNPTRHTYMASPTGTISLRHNCFQIRKDKQRVHFQTQRICESGPEHIAKLQKVFYQVYKSRQQQLPWRRSLDIRIVDVFILFKQYKDKTMGAGPSHWKWLNVINKLFTTIDVTTWDISSVHTHTHTHLQTQINASHYK